MNALFALFRSFDLRDVVGTSAVVSWGPILAGRACVALLIVAHPCSHGGPDNIRQTFSANVTLRDWATTFMPQFEACVESGGLGMMCSFNAIRGVPACANHRAMVTWAKKQWEFPGYIVSDQGAAWGIYSKTGHAFAKTVEEAAAYAVRGGLDLEDTDTPADSVLHHGLPGAVAQGLLSKGDIDQSVSRLM